jgi:hypothetical protein
MACANGMWMAAAGQTVLVFVGSDGQAHWRTVTAQLAQLWIDILRLCTFMKLPTKPVMDVTSLAPSM